MFVVKSFKPIVHLHLISTVVWVEWPMYISSKIYLMINLLQEINWQRPEVKKTFVFYVIDYKSILQSMMLFLPFSTTQVILRHRPHIWQQDPLFFPSKRNVIFPPQTKSDLLQIRLLKFININPVSHEGFGQCQFHSCTFLKK